MTCMRLMRTVVFASLAVTAQAGVIRFAAKSVDKSAHFAAKAADKTVHFAVKAVSKTATVAGKVIY